MSPTNYVFSLVSEIWLNDSFLNSKLSICNYNIFRCNRSFHTISYICGGGILKDVPSSLILFMINAMKHRTFKYIKI